jgi:hypothetical protein
MIPLGLKHNVPWAHSRNPQSPSYSGDTIIAIMELDWYCTGAVGMKQQSCLGVLWFFKRPQVSLLEKQRNQQHDIWSLRIVPDMRGWSQPAVLMTGRKSEKENPNSYTVCLHTVPGLETDWWKYYNCIIPESCSTLRFFSVCLYMSHVGVDKISVFYYLNFLSEELCNVPHQSVDFTFWTAETDQFKY